MFDTQQSQPAPRGRWWPPVLGAALFGVVRVLARVYNPVLGNFGEMALSIGAFVAAVLLVVLLDRWLGAARAAPGGTPAREDGSLPAPPAPARSGPPGRG